MRKAVLLIAAAGFAVGILLSLRSSPDLLRNVNWDAILVMALIATPATLALNAIEFSLSARLIGQTVAFGRATTVTILGSAANLLPLPGAALVRLAALKSGGATLRDGLSATALLAIFSLGLGFAYSGAWAIVIGRSPLATAILGIGIGVMIVAYLIVRQLFHNTQVVFGLVFVRIGLIALDAIRTYLAFVAIGYSGSFAQASVLTISTVLAAIITIVPGGLGLREGLAAFLGPFVGVGAAPAFLATSASRIVGLLIVLIAATVLALTGSSKQQPR